MANWTRETIVEKLSKYDYWYHKIDLGFGIVTPGLELDKIWDNIRKVRAGIDYNNKNVLDIAAFDGLFSFEAERLGAGKVIAADCLYKSFSNFLFAIFMRGSTLPVFLSESGFC